MTAAAIAPVARPEPRYLSGADVAKILRTELKAAFPAVKFRVTTSRGGTVNVSWTDGPTVRRVEAIVSRFEGKSFDGRDDSTHYASAFDYNSELVRSYSYIFTHRDLSSALVARVATAVARYYGFDARSGIPAVVEGWVQPTPEQEREARSATGQDWGTLIHRASADRSSVSRDGREYLKLVEG